MPGLAWIRQEDFSGGAYIGVRDATGIPANGVLDAVNVVVDDNGALTKRGGGVYLPGATWPSDPIVWVWQGTLTGGLRTVMATASNLYVVSGTGASLLGGYAGMAHGVSPPAVINGTMYFPNDSAKYDGIAPGVSGLVNQFYTTVANRLVAAGGAYPDMVSFSGVGTPTTFNLTDFWRIPGGAAVTGLAALRDAAVVFSTRGTWVISNMALNLTDADGNVQQRLDLYAPDLMLWGTGGAGVVGYGGGLVVPARDGIWLLRLGVTSEAAAPLELLSGPIAQFYRSLADAGYMPGQAAVHRGHYVLPIVRADGSVVTVLVCRLDRSARPWTRLAGEMPGAFCVTEDGASLLGPGGPQQRLATLDYFDGTTGSDPGGSAVDGVFQTRRFPIGSTPSTVVKVRAVGQMLDLKMGVQLATPALPDASPAFDTIDTVNEWRVGKRALAEFFTFDSPSAHLTIRSIEVAVRQSGR